MQKRIRPLTPAVHAVRAHARLAIGLVLAIATAGYALMQGVGASAFTAAYEAEDFQTAGTASRIAADGASGGTAVSFGNRAALPPADNPPAEPLPPEDIDHREYMHGVELVRYGGRDMLVFASNQYPPTSPPGEWEHDLFYSYIDPLDPRGSFDAKRLVSAPTAQEPASAAVNASGRLMVTAEDAQHSEYLDQTFGIWGPSLGPAVPYGAKLMPPQGGHSGHVAASGDKFLVSFSDGWIDGGGVDDLGTGDDVFGRVVNQDGTLGGMVDTAAGAASRDWWPIVAGSDSNWLQVWQRYGSAGTGGGTVIGAVIDRDGRKVRETSLYGNNRYYYYDVQYIPAIGRYLVVGSQNTVGNNGVAVLVDKAGVVVASKAGLPGTIREAQTVISADGRTAVYAVPDLGAAVLELSADSIMLRKTVAIDWDWDYMGTDGIFVGQSRVVFATGTQRGIRFIIADF